MAIIAGQQLSEYALESTQPRRVVVKLRARPESGTVEQSALPGIAESFPGISLKPYYAAVSPPPGSVRESTAATEGAGAARQQSYLVAELEPGSDATNVARALTDRPDVEIAYVEGGPTPPPGGDVSDPLAIQQKYLDEAPVGINARWAWAETYGAGVGFVDLERGWTLDHEDLVDQKISVISGLNKDFFGHGTAVLGEVAAAINGKFGVGIAPSVQARVVSQWRDNGEYRTDLAILSAAASMQRGDVMLLEAQTTYTTSGANFVPVEVEEAVFDAIKSVTDSGIVVIEAAGNGDPGGNRGVDLDAFVDMRRRQILNRSSADFRDSGAILVGAGSAAAPHSRLGFSNFGSRIDCFAWGERIATCGDGGIGNDRDSYTEQFGGTSGASPIVTGAAIILQSWAKRRRTVYSPLQLRTIMSDPALNTASASRADRIGVMPNIRTIIERELGQPTEVAAAERRVSGAKS